LDASDAVDQLFGTKGVLEERCATTSRSLPYLLTGHSAHEDHRGRAAIAPKLVEEFDAARRLRDLLRRDSPTNNGAP